MSSLQVSLAAIGGLTVVAVVAYNYWTSRQNTPKQAEPLTEPTGLHPDGSFADKQAIEPVLTTDFVALSPVEKKPHLDALIDVISNIEVEQAVSAQSVLAALPPTRRVGTKAFHIEGCCQLYGQWEPIQLGKRYVSFQAGVQLANRVGALNDIEFSEFVVKTQAFADAIGGTAHFSDMMEEVARGRELDQFASAHDVQLSFTLCARSAAWSSGYIQQHAARLGFVMGLIPGRMVLSSEQVGVPLLSLSFDTQAAMAEDPALSAIREFTLSLDVPQIAFEDRPFERMREVARSLADNMEGVITDGDGQVLNEMALDQIASDLQVLYEALNARELSAGSPQARRLFS
ncbi:MAG: cell division protein FtsZ [Comamonadaceae bacterium PBBC1]|nr:MAG: cell division protein FtsZ [Comamonadaceae bacterium PBBC1]